MVGVPGGTFFQWGGGGGGGGGGGLPLLQRTRRPRFTLRPGPRVPPWPGGLPAETVVGHLLLVGVEVPHLHILGAPLAGGGEVGLKHTCDCPRCMLHYETCIQSSMAQVCDLQSKNQELQRSHQELSQEVAAVAGISQSYGAGIAQILSTLAKHDEVVRGYQRQSKAMLANVANHLKMSNNKCFRAVETLAKHFATVASRLDA